MALKSLDARFDEIFEAGATPQGMPGGCPMHPGCAGRPRPGAGGPNPPLITIVGAGSGP